jgi:hypothetical protein
MHDATCTTHVSVRRCGNAQDSTSNAILYSRSLDPVGESWPSTLVTVDGATPTNPKAYLSLGLVGGAPTIVYTAASANGATNRLLFIRARDGNGTAFPAAAQVLLNVETTYHSLAVVNGVPAMYVRRRPAAVWGQRCDGWGRAWIAGVAGAAHDGCRVSPCVCVAAPSMTQ